MAKEIVVSLGLSDRVGVVAMTKDHAARLLTPAQSALGGVLTDADRPRAMAASFHWAGLVDAATPWVEFAVRKAVGEEPSGTGETPKAKRPKGKRAAKAAEVKKAETPAPEAGKEKPVSPEAKKVDSAKAVHAKQPADKKAAVGKAPETRKPRRASVMDQVRVVLKVLKVIPSITGESYQEGDALVTHTLVEIRDID